MLPASINVQIPPVRKTHPKLALGCWAFAGEHWGGQPESETFAAMEVAWEQGLRHWDTAIAYGKGYSERLCGRFLKGKWDEVFVATKGDIGRKPQSIVKALRKSLENLGADSIDLYYIHYPKSGVDMRPHLELLEKEREKGTIRAIGVSNFSVPQMMEISQAGRIDAHQLGYNLLWRVPESDLIPYCIEKKIAVVSYCSLAQGILTGKFPAHPLFGEDDIRPNTVPFATEVWPHVYEAVRSLKDLAGSLEVPLSHLAIQWLAQQPGITSLIVGSRNSHQADENAAAFLSSIPPEAFHAMTAISDSLQPAYQGESNIFRWYP